MIVSLDLGGEEVDLAVDVLDERATVGDLARAVAAGDVSAGLAVDGTPLELDRPLVGSCLRHGSRLSLDGGAPPSARPVSAATLVTGGGLACAETFQVAAGRRLVGRHPSCDVRLPGRTVPRRWGWLVVADDGSVVDGHGREVRRLRVGAEVLTPAATLEVVPAATEPGADGTVVLHRPPARQLPPHPAPLAPPRPAPAPAPGERPALAWAAAVVPLAGGLMLAALVDARMALFCLLGPAMLVGQWLDDLRRHRAHRRRAAASSDAHVAAVRRALVAAAGAETDRRSRMHPAPELVGAHVEATGTLVWHRGPAHPAFGQVVLGHGPLPWSPPVHGELTGPAAALVRSAALPDAPVVASLRSGRHLGIHGPRSAVLALARSVVVQLAALHAPGDLVVEVRCRDDRVADWRFTRWLPSADRRGHRVVVSDGAPAEREAPSVLSIAESERFLDGRCDQVLAVDTDGWAHQIQLPDAPPPGGFLVCGLTAATADRLSRALAPLREPGAGGAGAGGLLDQPAVPRGPEAVVERWSRHDGGITVPLGVHGNDTIDVDLDRDGPHALVAGTTGSGKSELLRTLVAGLALGAGPDRVTFLLVDYKGGAAFGACRLLPHCVGLVTDLDGGEAERALRSLHAELRWREAAAASPGAAPPPRLVVVVDEFAALASEHPSFLDGLVQVAARGRSLGVHLVLATQRPAGVVSPSIRANANLRLCLRVTDDADALDVVGTAEPARFDRHQPGLAVLRRGDGDTAVVRVWQVTGSRPGAGAAAREDRLRVRVRPAAERPPDAPSVGLDDVVAWCRQAAARLRSSPPRRPWLDPLPEAPAVGATTLERVHAGECDDPDRQRRLPLTWQPLRGPLCLVGNQSSGPAMAMRAVLAMLAGAAPPDRLHIHGLAFGAARLGELRGWPHVGTVAGPRDDEVLHRLLGHLSDLLADRQRRTASSLRAAADPLVVLAVDGVGAVRQALDGSSGIEALAALERLAVDGPAHGVSVVATADRPGSLLAGWLAGAGAVWAFRLGDPVDEMQLGIAPPDAASWPTGRCVDTATGLLAQVAPAPPPPAAPAARPAGSARRLGALPDDVALGALPSVRGSVVIGVRGTDLQPAAVELRAGDLVVVSGPPRSGRSTALATLAAQGRTAGLDVVVVDDADRRPDDDPELTALLADPGDAVVVVGCRPEVVRGAYTGWPALLRRCRTGLVLRPRSELDGDVLGVALLPRTPVPLGRPGRGFLVVDGDAELVQVAQ